MKPEDLIDINEDRRHEFKGEMPTHSDLAKTVCAFANDAGGEIFIGIDKNKQIVGLDEDALPKYEEQLSNMIYDRCYPSILPEISFLTIDDKHLLHVRIYRGSMPPYYLKEEGKLKGTYVRVGSSNRLADDCLIAELERKRRSISFDSEVVLDKKADELNISGFKELFEEKTGEQLTPQVLRKLELVKEEQGAEYPTNALVLLSDDALRNSLFPNATIECARFKGTTADFFIDQKHIGCNIAQQPEEAYNFVLKHINKGASVQGVYTVARWEYPIKAIREVIRNAVVHRQYSLTGKDIKIAIYDDMVEITSPGLLPPSIDFANMRSRQSDARNKVVAPVFKHIGLIDKWGNGLMLIDDELKEYPDIEMRWHEVGMSFQVQFVNKAFVAYDPKEGENDPKDDPKESNVTKDTTKNVTKDVTKEITERQKVILDLISKYESIAIPEMSRKTKVTERTIKRDIEELMKKGILSREGGRKEGRWVVNQF